jgi:transcriptional regulator with GAF, ATPase, and Fis domain
MMNRDNADEIRSGDLTIRIEILKALSKALLSEIESLEKANGKRSDEKLTFYDEVKAFEVELILSALVQAGGKQTEASRLLGMNNTTLNSMIKRHNIQWKKGMKDITLMRQPLNESVADSVSQ